MLVNMSAIFSIVVVFFFVGQPRTDAGLLIGLVFGADVGFVGKLLDWGVRGEAEVTGAHEVLAGGVVSGDALRVADEVAAGGAGDGAGLWL